MQADDVLITGASVASIVVTGTLGAAALRIRGRAAFVAAALVIAAATVVLVALALSFVELYRRGPILIAQCAVFAVVATTWWWTGRPRPPIGRIPGREDVLEAIRGHRSVAVLVAAGFVAFCVEAILAVGVVPNNVDSMYYHLSRAAYWLQYDSVLQFPGGTVFQLQNPPNAEIIQSWTMELSNGERLAQLVQWTALCGLACVIYSGARLLRFGAPASIFAAALFVTLPQPVLQGSTTQNDLVAAFFFSAAVLFLVRSIASADLGNGVVGAIAFGLSVGTKGTALVAVPAFFVLIFAALWHWRPPRRFLVRSGGLLVGAVILLGSVNYIETTRTTGTPWGDLGSTKQRHEPVLQSAAKNLWGFVDLPGFGQTSWMGDILDAGNEQVWNSYTASYQPDTAVHEDITGYGPIGLLVLLPVLAVSAFRRRGPRDRRVLAVAALTYVATYLLFLEAEPYSMRTMMIGIALGAPLLAIAAEIDWLRHAVALVTVVILVPCLFYNLQKPLRPGHMSIRLDEAGQRAGYNEILPMLRSIDEVLPSDARLAFIGTNTARDYPFFGTHHERYIIRSEPDSGDERSVSELMQANDLDAVVWAEYVEPPENIRTIDLGNGYLVHVRRDTGTRTPTPP